MRSRTTTSLAASLALLFLVQPSLAQKPDPTTRVAVRALAVQGDAAWDRGDLQGALEKFRKAYALIPAPTLLLRQAECLQKMGQWIQAVGLYREVSRTRLAPDSPPPFAVAVAQAGKTLAVLEPKLPKLRFSLHGDDLEDAQLFVDGQAVPRAAWGVPWPANPGKRSIALVKDTRRAETTVVAKEASTTEVSLSLPARSPMASVPAVPAASSSGDASTVAESPSSTLRYVGWAGVAVGSAGLVLSAITGGMASAKKGDLRAGEVPAAELASEQENVDSYRQLRTISTVGFWVGIASVGAGVTLLLTAPPAASANQQAAVTPWVGLGSAGVSGRF